MNMASTTQMISTDLAAGDAPSLWLPPRPMRQYQIAKFVAAALMAGIFVGWLYIQWDDTLVRWLMIVLIVVTGWVTIGSMLSDARRTRGRQITIDPQGITIVTPIKSQRVAWHQTDHTRWQEDAVAQPGLWLYDKSDSPLGHIDMDFLADAAEARRFLAWAQLHTDCFPPVRWPDYD